LLESPRVREQFIQDGERFYDHDGALAFQDHGRRLSTPVEQVAVVAILVEVARDRAWSEIALAGTELFRREAWRLGRLAGLEVRGYRASATEHAEIIRTMAVPGQVQHNGRTRQPSPSITGPDRGKEDDADIDMVSVSEAAAAFIEGRLLAHGLEDGQPGASKKGASYFLRVETRDGVRTIRGAGLKRALDEAVTQPKIGEVIGVRLVRSVATTVGDHQPPDSHQAGEVQTTEWGFRWVIERREFLEARRRAARILRDSAIEPHNGVREYPELVGPYLRLRAAELVASRLLDDSDVRRKFVQGVRDALADSVERGDPIKPVRVRKGGADTSSCTQSDVA
jgi:hypothetical protein